MLKAFPDTPTNSNIDTNEPFGTRQEEEKMVRVDDSETDAGFEECTSAKRFKNQPHRKRRRK